MASQPSTDLLDMEFPLTDLDERALLADIETLLNSEIFLTSERNDVESSSTGSENEVSRSKEAWKHHIYRQRQRNEREALRLQERELTQLLVQVKQDLEPSRTLEIGTRPTLYFLAKAFATRQQEERLCAEAEQRSLILAVRAQAKRIEAVSSVFRKRLDQLQGVSHQNHTKLDEHQELENYVETLIQTIDWMTIKHSTLRNLCATLTASYGAAQKTLDLVKEETRRTIGVEKSGNKGDQNAVSANSTSVGSSVSQSRVVKKVRPIGYRSRTFTSRSFKYSQKQKGEKDSLNRQVKNLTMTLKMLWTENIAAQAARGRGEASAAAWKTLANRQLQAQLVAEEEYHQLHQEVERRSALIENIGMVFRKRARVEVVGAVYPSPKQFRSKTPDITLYEAYINQLDEIYAQTDDIFSEIIVGASTNSSDFYKESRSTGSTYHELVGTAIAPFPFARVRQVVCRCQCMLNRPGSEKYNGPGISDSTTAVKVCITDPRSGDSTSSLVQVAMMRRYDEDSRVVNVWKKCTEGKEAFAGMHCEETGWCIVRPALNGYTVLESVVRFMPLTYSTAATSNSMLKQFIGAIIKVREDDCKSCSRDLERKMLNSVAY